MYDLVISEHGDLVMAGNRDLAGVSGIDLLEQRMRIRLMLHRGSWAFDPDDTLGSALYTLMGMPPDSAGGSIDPLVRQALKPMENEISVDEVWIAYEQSDGAFTQEAPAVSRSILVIVVYHVQPSSDEIATEIEPRRLEVVLPLGGF
jgi:phage baseplate assembly protein W